LSSLSSLTTSTFQNAAITSQQEINDILKTLSTGLSINSAGTDPSNLAISDKLNSQALDAASTSTNAQNGLTYLQIAQQAYSNIVTELNKVKDVANTVLNGSYSDSELQTFQDSITKSVNQIKLIEEGTMFNGVQVFNNSNSSGTVNEHMFAITSKTVTTTTITTITGNRGDDYSSYLSSTVNRYIKQADGTLVNGVDATLTPGTNVVTIETADDLIAALDNQNSAGKTYVLLDNIDLSGKGLQSAALLRGDFQGTLLGNGYAISGLNINSTGDNVGLFENNSGTVKDLVLKDFNITGHVKVGALAGKSYGTVSNVAVVNANVTGNTGVGALAGSVSDIGSIDKSYSTGSVTGGSTVGGLVGNLMEDATISNSFSTATVNGGQYVGGLVGFTESNTVQISSSYAMGDVTGNIDVGGLIGFNSATVTNSYSLGQISGQTNAAGLIGYNAGSVSNSYSLSDITDTTAVYAVSNFVTSSTGETVAGTSVRPNEAYNTVYDWGGKTWAFSNVADFNTFKDYTTGTASTQIAQFYELTDVANNIWTGRTLQPVAPTYTQSTIAGASVANMPNSAFGNFNVLYTTGPDTYAFASDADKNAFTGSNGAVSLFYKFNTATKAWDSLQQTLDATSGQYNYNMTAQGSNIVSSPTDGSDNYNVIKTIGGGSAGTYAFTTETDATNFNNGTFIGTIGKYYKLNGTTWDAYSVTATPGTVSYSNTTTATGINNVPDDTYTYTTTGADGKKYAFSSSLDLATFGNGTNITGNIASFKRLEADGYWNDVYTASTGGGYALTDLGSSVNNNSGYYAGYTFQKSYDGYTYGFASQANADEFDATTGRFSSNIGDFVKETSTNNWQLMNTAFGGQTATGNYIYNNSVSTSITPHTSPDDSYYGRTITGGVGFDSLAVVPGVTQWSGIYTESDAEFNDFLTAATPTVEGTGTQNINFTAYMKGNNAQEYKLTVTSTAEMQNYYVESGTATNYTTTPSVQQMDNPGAGYTTMYVENLMSGTNIYAFASAADKSNFLDGTGNVDALYKYNGSTWDLFSSNPVATTYSIANAGSFITPVTQKTEVEAGIAGYNAAHIIHNASELVNKITADLSGNFIMVGDIDMSSLGTLTTSAVLGDFAGNFDGNGYKVSNLTINTGAASVNNEGLFSRIVAGGSVNNLAMENISVRAINSWASGTVAGRNDGTISNSYAKGTVAGGSQYAGGLVGYNTGTITQSFTGVSVSGTDWKIGGLVGESIGNISSSYATGSVEGVRRTGGLVGNASAGTITNSYASGSVSGVQEIGGFIGYNFGSSVVTKSYASGNVTGTGANVGGFVGLNVSSVNATNFYKNNKANDGGSAVNANVFAMPTGTWSSAVWNFGGTLPSLTFNSLSQYSKPDDFAYNNTLYNDGSVNRYFANTIDRDKYIAYVGGTMPSGENFTYYQQTGTGQSIAWDKKQLVSTTTPVTYNANPGPTGIVSKPNDPNYMYSYTSVGGTIGSGTWSFDTLESKNNFISINGGSKAGFADIYTYKYNGSTWDMEKISGTKTPDTYTVGSEASGSVIGKPDKENYNVFSADNQNVFANATDLANFNNGTPIGAVSNFYHYNTATNQWDAQKVATNPTTYSIGSAGGIVNPGLAQRPNVDEYTYLYTVAAGVNAGNYAFNSVDSRQNFIDFATGAATSNPIDNYYKMAATTSADPVTGKLSNQWTSQSLKYDNNVGFLVGKNTGTITNSVFGTGTASDSFIGDDVVYMLGNAQLASAASAPLNTWSGAIWDFTGSKPTLKSMKPEGSENIDPNNLSKLADEVFYTTETKDDYASTSTRLNVALIDYSNTISTISAGYDAAHTITSAADFVSKISANLGGNFILSSNIDMSSRGILSDALITGNFTGSLDGNGYKISNLTINSTGKTGVGIFKSLSGSAQVKDLELYNININAGTNTGQIGALAGGMFGSVQISNIKATSITIRGGAESMDIGGLVGVMAGGEISNSTADVTLDGARHVGGLVGLAIGSSSIKNSSTSGQVNITQSYAADNDRRAGGLVGIIAGSAIVDSSSSSANVYNKYSYAGGIAGLIATNARVTNTYATGNAIADMNYAGGFAGDIRENAYLENDYATGDATGPSAGSFYASNASGSSYTGVIKNSFATGSGSFGPAAEALRMIDNSGALTAADVSSKSAAFEAVTSSWDARVWDLSGSTPILKNTGYVSTANSSALLTKTFATNKLISEMTVSNASDPNQIFTEGKDFTTYSNDNGATWNMDILSSAMLEKNIKIDYQGVATGTVNQATTGFNLYLGNNTNLNVKDMVLDLAGRLNFNVTKDTGAQATLDAISGISDYMDVKKLELDGSIKLATAALNNKTTKSSTFSSEVKNINNYDEAKQQAALVAAQAKLQNFNDFFNKFSYYHASLAKSLLGYKGYAGTDYGLYTGFTGVNSTNNNAINDYNYKTLKGL